MNVTSAAGILSLLDEPRHDIKTFALRRLDSIVDEFWPEISESIEKIEVLQEDPVFKQRELAALVASKVYYHLGFYDDSLSYALGAGTLFDVYSNSQYVETMISKCIDQYIKLRQALIDEKKLDTKIDATLESVVNKMFQRCLAENQFQHALGIALEARRLDIFQAAIIRSGDIYKMLKYAYDVSMNLIQNRSFRNTLLRKLVDLYGSLATPDYINVCQCLIFLDDANSVARILSRLAAGEMEDELTAYQIAFDLYESATQEFLGLVMDHLHHAKESPIANNVGTSSNTGFDSNTIDVREYDANIDKLKTILSGEISILLHLQFLIRANKTDYLILKHTKDSARPSICHTAVVIANAFMHSGTTSDCFLRDNLEWLSRASNWSKMTAVASLGVIHRGHEKDALNFMQTYLPKESGPTAGYTESGALYALGLIHANHGSKITPYLLQQLKDAPNEIIKHGGCLGIGLAAMGTRNEDIYEQIKFNLYQDDAVVGEAAGIAMGLIMLGSKHGEAIEDMVAYCHESQHEKILRGLAVGIALTMFGRLEEADDLISRLVLDKDPILRRSAMYTVAMAYCGTGNNLAIRRLLHIAVSDVNDDVRRAAVTSLGFLLFR
ncbi:PREDICTED: 26S proteasome non-ATPase regulatory subunit 1-like [Nicrophorus vespilloides]|uniref:26S proteasome non-ATPase regulatory subunit 1-like n=1 Tax=Nicrophorus vespilloides TaxID=110193 RepID=A0ABM1MHB7_NICVS|nr:PREDICTED: 26S proteasome non-ATPase regulatory subunit 1-like [Nicrophorus vespilloides]